jgi:hypothetical protein
LGGVSLCSAQGPLYTDVNAYALPSWHADYVVEPVLSVGDIVPQTSNLAAGQFQFVGIPDGMGAYNIPGSQTVMNVAHEFGWTTLSRPVLGGDRIRGAFVSSYVISNVDRGVLSGDLAFTTTNQDGVGSFPIATETNGQPAFARFCSAYQAGPYNGFNDWIFIANEEAGIAFGATYYDATTTNLGSQTVAVFKNRAHALSGVGHFSKENTVARPYTPRAGYNNKIVLLSFEDGPNSAPYSGVYMYVGQRNFQATDPNPVVQDLKRNGLVGGQLYYLKSINPAVNDESDITVEGASQNCQWVLAPNAATQTETDLKNEMTANDFFKFSRPEDGHYNPRNPNQWIFVTTGEGDLGNTLGRIYELRLNATNPTGPCQLILKYNAATSLLDGPLAPDNMVFTASGDILVQEDGTSTSRPVYNTRNRNAGIWKLNIARPFNEREFVVGQTDIGRDNILAHRGTGTVVGSQTGFPITQRGLWETTGIIDHRFVRGRRAYNGFLFAVQAHSPTTAPVADSVEDGQILFMAPCVIPVRPNELGLPQP